MGTPNYQSAGQSCTTLEERQEYAKLPGNRKGYLTEKALVALQFPKVITVRRKDGSSYQSLLQQVVVSSTIRLEEARANFYWQYKAEVSFDMTPTRKSGGVPKPFLSSGNQVEGTGRRHSLNPFPPGRTVGYLRRPDVIIVKDEHTRWPGLATTDHEGQTHADNLLRVVELKFPGDDLDESQKNAYKLIAGGDVERLCIVDVNDCEGDLRKARRRAPVRSPQPIAEPAFYERWLVEADKDIASMWDSARQGVAQLSSEAQAWLRQRAPWLFAAGRWVRDTSGQVYQWVSEKGQVLATWTLAQLNAAWASIAKATDLAWEQLKSIDWSQVVIDVVQGLCVIGMCIAGVMVGVALAPELLAALLALVGIAATA